MERKLTLQDICGYIPYGLCKVNDLYRHKIEIVNTLNNGVNDLIYRSDLYKPILRPLSDLYLVDGSANQVNQYQLFDFLHELKIDYRWLIEAKLGISCYDLDTNPYN